MQELSQVLLIGVLDLGNILTDLEELVQYLHTWDFAKKSDESSGKGDFSGIFKIKLGKYYVKKER